MIGTLLALVVFVLLTAVVVVFIVRLGRDDQPVPFVPPAPPAVPAPVAQPVWELWQADPPRRSLPVLPLVAGGALLLAGLGAFFGGRLLFDRAAEPATVAAGPAAGGSELDEFVARDAPSVRPGEWPDSRLVAPSSLAGVAPAAGDRLAGQVVALTRQQIVPIAGDEKMVVRFYGSTGRRPAYYLVAFRGADRAARDAAFGAAGIATAMIPDIEVGPKTRLPSGTSHLLDCHPLRRGPYPAGFCVWQVNGTTGVVVAYGQHDLARVAAVTDEAMRRSGV